MDVLLPGLALLETATALLEPVDMAVMGGVFAVLLVATMLPMVRVVQTL